MKEWFSGPGGGLFLNLVAAAIGATAAQIARDAKRRYRERKARHFWKSLVTRSVFIVVGVHDRDRMNEWERSGLVGFGCVEALTSVTRQLTELGIDNYEVVLDNFLSPKDWRSDLILIGGPDVNELTAAVMRRLPLRYTYASPEIHQVAIFDSREQTYIVSETEREGGVVTDYGLVIRVPNPFNPGSQVLILAGNWGYGTAAGAQVLREKAFLNNSVVLSGKPFEALIETSVAGNSSQLVAYKDVLEVETSPA